MATELGKAYVQIVPSARGIKGSITKELGGEVTSSGKKLGAQLGGALMSALKTTVKAGAAGVGAIIAGGVLEGGKLEQSIGGIETLFKDSADTVRKNADNAYKTAGISANRYMEQATSFSATLLQGLGGDTTQAAKYADKAIRDMGDNANKFGTDISSVQDAYQGFAKDNYTMLDNLRLGYGGTAGEMARLINDSGVLGDTFTATAENVKDIPFDRMIEAIHVVQQELGITGTTAEEAAETLQGSFGAMSAAFKNTIGGLALGEDITDELNALAETVSVFFFSNFIPMVGNIIRGLPGAISTFLQAGRGELSNAFLNLMNGLNIPISEGLYQELKTVANRTEELYQPIVDGFRTASEKMDFSGIMSLAESILPALSTAFDSFMSLVGPALGDLITAFGELWNALQPVFELLGEALGPVLELLATLIGVVLRDAIVFVTGAFEVLASILEFISPLFEFLAGVIEGVTLVLQTIVEWIGSTIGEFDLLGIATDILKEILTQAWNSIGEVIQVAKEKISLAISNIKDFFTSLGDAGNELKRKMSQAWEEIKNAVSNAGKRISDTVEDIKGWFNSLKDINLRSAGQAIMNSFYEGLTSAWGKVKDFVGGIGTWIKNNKGPIEYDRRLLIPAGKAIMQGLDSGLQKQFETVKDTVTGMAPKIAEAFKPISLMGDIHGPEPAPVTTSAIYQSEFNANEANVMRGVASIQESLNSLGSAKGDIVLEIDGQEVGRLSAGAVDAEQAIAFDSVRRGLELGTQWN